MTIDVEGLKARTDIVKVVGAHVALKKKGPEYVGLCPFHNDHNPSFWVNPVKRFCHCFSCDANHDVISFLQEVEGIDFKAACERLGADVEWKPVAPIKAATRDPLPERVTSKPPAGAATPAFATRDLGEPELVFPIRDLDGSILGYECRYKGEGGRKEIRVWTWGQRGARAASWGMGHFNAPRPLFGLERLREFKPDDQVNVFEGPKKAEAGQRLLPGRPSLSWTGGANAWHKHDWAPLRGRRVLLWPDADEPGITAAEKLAALLADRKGLACTVRIVDPNRMPEGWDVADGESEGWDWEKLEAWARPRIRDFAQPENPPAEPAPKPQAQRRPMLSVVDGNAALKPAEDAEALPASMSEDAIADQFAKAHAMRWRYVKPWSTWFEWRGDGWYRDDTAKIDRLAVEMTRQALYWPEAASMSPDGRRKVNSRRTAGAVRDLALSDRRIAALTDQWDRDSWLLGVPGGAVDLRTGRLQDARAEDYITKRTVCAPEQGPAPIWDKFLNTVTDDNAKLRDFMQVFAGYALTGETREQCLAFLYGTGQNGKGVFITTIAAILGDYAVSCDADVFMESEQQRHPTEMARLRAARLVYVDETDSSKRWNEKRIKRVTGGGRIEARFMKQDHFEFIPQFKLLIAGNHKPQLRGVGKAMQRRIHLVPFTVTIRDEDRDEELSAKLEAEYPQILQWMVDGCARWRELGLQPPAEVIDATRTYIESEDVIGEWLEERTDQRGETQRPLAYKNYRAWMDARGERPWSTKAFWAALEERGYSTRKSVGAIYIRGLGLRSSVDDSPPSARYSD